MGFTTPGDGDKDLETSNAVNCNLTKKCEPDVGRCNKPGLRRWKKWVYIACDKRKNNGKLFEMT